MVQVVRKKPLLWRPHHDLQVKHFHGLGLTAGQIAKRICRSVEQVEAALERLDLEPHQARGAPGPSLFNPNRMDGPPAPLLPEPNVVSQARAVLATTGRLVNHRGVEFLDGKTTNAVELLREANRELKRRGQQLIGNRPERWM